MNLLHLMLDRLRLLPTVMLVAAMLLGLKVVHMVGGLADVAMVAPAEAQAASPSETETAKAPVDTSGKTTEADAVAKAEPAATAEAEGEQKADASKAHGGGMKPMSAAEKEAALAAQTAALKSGNRMSQAEIAVLGSLASRREEIDQRSKAFDTREKLLAAAEKRVEERIVELKAIEARINSQISANDKQNEERLKDVVQMYETMKPKDAARIFERLDMGVLIDVAKRMNPRKMSAVLAMMDPVAAQDLTVELATGGRLPGMPDQKADMRKPAASAVVVPAKGAAS
jgi:flagellar motility protein MotE (MotC chaperone)